MPILESSIYGLWTAKQSAKGTPATASSRRPIMVAGDFGFNRDEGEENYSDLSLYGASTDFINIIEGAGEPGCQATPSETAHWAWLFAGAETVTNVLAADGTTVIALRHRTVPSAGLGHPFTAWLRVGRSVIRRHKFNDCYATRLAIEGSTANKVVRVTPRVLSLDPAELFTTDPTTAMPTESPLLYTDGRGAFTIDGTVYRGITQFSFAADNAWTTVSGDAANAFDFVQGDPSVTIGCTLHLDAAALSLWNIRAYGSAAPAAGTKPLQGVPALGSFSMSLKQRNSAGAINNLGLDITIPGVKWDLPAAPAPNPGGGGVELALAGRMRPVAGQEPYTIDVITPTGTTAFTA